MTDQVNHGDSTQQTAASQADTATHASMQRLANDFLDQGISNATKGGANAAPESAAGKFAAVTAEGAKAAVPGVWHAVVEDVTHPLDTAKMIGTSAAMGVVLKTVLPETGAVGKIAGAGIGLYFASKAAEPIYDAYSKGMQAKTQDDIKAAGHQVGDAVGGFAVNSVVAAGGYRLGSGFAGKALAAESMDSFAVLKEKVWHPSSTKTEVPADLIGKSTDAPAMQARYKVDGNRAHLVASDRGAPENAKAVGDVDPKAPMDVTVYAQTKGSSLVMDRTIARIGAGKQAPLTDAQITEKFGSDQRSVDAITAFAKQHGLEVAEHNAASGRMRLTGATENMMNAFGVKLQEYTHANGTTFRGRTGTVSVPTELASNVKAVMGLDNRPQFRTNYIRGPVEAPATAGQVSGAVGQFDAKAGTEANAAPRARALGVEEVFKAYNADAKLSGKGMTTGFLSLGGTLAEGWDTNLKGKGIDPGKVEIRNTSTTEPTPDPRGANGENQLDLDIHAQGLPDATTVMVQAENSDTGMPTGIDRATFPQKGESQITHFSISWGQFEDGWTDQARTMMNDAGKRAALKGLTITVASGDNGAGDNSPSHKQQVDVPAGLANFTASGGTRLTVNADGTFGTEVGWDGMGASGGGRSMKEPRPDYQKDVVMPPNLNGSKFDGRGVPDIAANADPRSGWKVWTDDGETPIGGTSAAAPADAVIGAKITEATKRPTGFWNPELYSMFKSNPEAFHDITSGKNTDGGVTGYPAGKGWDAETGLGSIDVGKYIDARLKLQNRNVFQRNIAEVPSFLRTNQTTTPIWGTPYMGQLQTPSDNSNK